MDIAWVFRLVRRRGRSRTALAPRSSHNPARTSSTFASLDKHPPTTTHFPAVHLTDNFVFPDGTPNFFFHVSMAYLLRNDYCEFLLFSV